MYRAWARATGTDLAEVRQPLEAYASLGAFFVRRLAHGTRTFPTDPRVLPSPVDGRVQGFGRVGGETLLQAKGRPYSVRELLGGAGAELDLDGAWAWTLYLSPRDYHRVHSPHDARLTEVRWLAGSRYSVHPDVLLQRSRVLDVNERAVLRLESAAGPFFVVLVGALNVGRIRVVGVPAGVSGPITPPAELRRGDELGRFEMGSTVVLLWPPGGPAPVTGLAEGEPVRMGQAIGAWA